MSHDSRKYPSRNEHLQVAEDHDVETDLFLDVLGGRAKKSSKQYRVDEILAEMKEVRPDLYEIAYNAAYDPDVPAERVMRAFRSAGWKIDNKSVLNWRDKEGVEFRDGRRT